MKTKKPNRSNRHSEGILSTRRSGVVSSPSSPRIKPQADTSEDSPTRKSGISKKTIRICIISIITIIVVIGLFIHHDSTTQNSDTRTVSMSPEYPTVLPEGKSVDTLGGWQRISPPNNDPVFAYSDKIGEIPISVSQQPLPESFKGDIDSKVADVAKKFNATNKVSAGNTTIYIGTSSKGPQSVIFTQKNLLILIKSQKKIDDAMWSTYAQSLN